MGSTVSVAMRQNKGTPWGDVDRFVGFIYLGEREDVNLYPEQELGKMMDEFGREFQVFS